MMETSKTTSLTKSSSSSDPVKDSLMKMLKQENRPFTMSDIHERLGKQLNKQSLQKCLDLQVAKSRILEKTYGKLKVYCINNKQSKVNGEALRADLKKLDEKMLVYSQSIDSNQERIKAIESQLKKSADDVPLPVLQAQHDTLTESVNKLQLQVDAAKKREGPTLDPKEFEKLSQNRVRVLQAYNKRKQICMGLIDGIMEGYPKSKQKLIEDTEIETDEAAGFDINQYK